MESRNPRIQTFWEHVPREYMSNVLRAVFDCYMYSDEICTTHLEREEAHDISPFMRRGLIEAALREAAKPFPQIQASVVRNSSGNWHHTRIVAGRVLMTQNAAGCPEAVVKPSNFRFAYAAQDNVRYLFPEMQPPEPPPDSVLYGILIHGRAERSQLFPGFANVVFPKPDLTSNHDGYVDLFREFPEVVKEKTQQPFGPPEGEHLPEPEIRLRPQGKAE